MTIPGNDPLNRPAGAGVGPNDGREGVTESAERLGEQIKQKAADYKQQAVEGAQHLGESARSAAEEQKNSAAERMGGVAHAIRAAADDLRDQGQPGFADYSRQLADGLEQMAESLSRRDLDEVVEGVEQFARQRPVAFVGGAMAAGFALARFMKSSGRRRHAQGGHSYGYAYGQTPYSPGAPATPDRFASAGTRSGPVTAGAGRSVSGSGSGAATPGFSAAQSEAPGASPVGTAPGAVVNKETPNAKR